MRWGLISKHIILSGLLVVQTAVATSTDSEMAESCIAGGSSPAKLRLGSSGFHDEALKVVEGVAGPEFQIGKTRIFLDPKSNEDTETKSSEPDRNNSWCIVDPVLAQSKGKTGSAVNEPMCGTAELFGEKAESKFFKDAVQIHGAKGNIIAEIRAKEDTDENGKKFIRLIVKATGSGNEKDRAENQLHLNGHATKTGEKITSKLRVESRQFDKGTVNGVVESTVSGFDDTSSTPNDPMKGYKLKGCQSAGQSQGQLRKKGDKTPENLVDISGSHIVMRGKECYGINQYIGNEDKDAKPEYMVSQIGRDGGG